MKTITVRLSAAPACLLSDQIDLSVTSSFPLKSERPPSIRPHCPLSRCLSLYMPYAAGSTRNPLRRLDASSLRYVLSSAAPHSMKGLVQAVPAANVLRSLTQGLNSDFGMYSLNTSLTKEHCTTQYDPLYFCILRVGPFHIRISLQVQLIVTSVFWAASNFFYSV